MANEEQTKEVPSKISDQAILMLKLPELARYSSNQNSIPIFPIENKSSLDFIGLRRFNNLCVVDYEYPYAIPNMLLSHDEESSAMMKLTTLQLSLLIPRIRVFKTVFDVNLKEELHIELPFDDVADKADIERIFSSGEGRGSGCGLKSFEWKSLGKNQANLAQFSAKMELYLQNIEEIQQIRNSAKLENGRTISVSVLDLLYQKPDLRSGFNEGSNTYDSKYFGIKVEVGWNLDDNVIEDFKSESRRYGDDPDKVLSIVKKQKSIFYLTLVSHQLDFKPDGTIGLSIDYIASVELEAADTVSSNVLKLSDINEKQLQSLLRQQREINSQINSLKIASSKNEEAFNRALENKNITQPQGTIRKGTDGYNDFYQEHSLTQDEEKYKSLIEQKKQIDQGIEQFKKSQRIERLTSIIQRMTDYNLINNVTVDKKYLEILTNWQQVLVETQDDLDRLRSDFDTIRNNMKIIPKNSLDQTALEMLNKINESNTNTEDDKKSVLKFDGITIGDIRKQNTDDYFETSFFFFGDLLNIVLENIFNDDNKTKINNFISKTTRILLGSITYYDFGSIVNDNLVIRTKGIKDQNGELISVYRGKQTIINIADIPISLREFQRWFVNNVVNKAREVYSFWDFSKDLIDDLLISAISGETFKFVPRQQVKISMLPFSSPKLEYNEGIFESILNKPDRTNVDSFRVTIANKKSLISGKALLPFLNSDLKASKQNYLLFYGTNQPPFERIADEKKDLEQRIYHVYIGEERGLIKHPTFSRDDNPRQRAANIQASNPEKQQDGVIIREKYSANLKMVGNFLFLPGQQIFIHPTYPGLKGRNVRENIFRKLGLGGYYRVIEINSKLASGEFTTTLSTKWDAFGDGTMNLGDQLVGQVVNKDSLMSEDAQLEQSTTGAPNRIKLVAE